VVKCITKVLNSDIFLFYNDRIFEEVPLAKMPYFQGFAGLIVVLVVLVVYFLFFNAREDHIYKNKIYIRVYIEIEKTYH